LPIVTPSKQTFRIAAFAALLLLMGCSPGTPDAGVPGNAAHAVHKSCEQTCNAEYDSCMDRFTGMGTGGGPGLGRHQDDANADLGPNDVCPDQLRACLKRCTP
jgi:hypothetical protein